MISADAGDLDELVDLGGNSDDEVPDTRKHAKLIDAISSLDGKKNHRLSQRTVPTAQVSEFGFTSSNNKNAKVRLHELVGSLKDTTSHGELKKHLRTIDKRSKVVSVPLPKHEQGKIERSVAYEKTSDELKKWDPVVKENRTAEQIVFPLNQPSLKLHTASKFAGIKPRTPLEMEVAALLQGSPNIPTKNKELTKAEEKALQAMSIEEAKERRAELQKHRALLSYKESKARWQKKIKSKKYHKVLRKEKLKHEKKALDELEKNDPDGYQEKIDDINKQRIQERMNLKHRGGSKYAKKQMIYAKYDDKARQSVQDMLQKSRDLTKKMITETGESDSDGGVSMDSEDERAMMESEMSGDRNMPQKNPWMSVGSKHPQTTGFEKPVAIVSTDSQQDQSELPVSQQDQSELPVSMAESESQTNEDANIDEIEKIFKSPNVNVKKENSQLQSNVKAKEDKKQAKKKAKKQKSKQNKSGTEKDQLKIIKPSKDVTEELEEEEDDDLITETLTRKQTLEDIEDGLLDKEEMDQNKTSNNKNSTREISRQSKDKSTEVQVDPKKLFTLESKLSNIKTPDVVTGNDEEDDDLDADEQQRLTIAQAFENDDVIEEFTKEKKGIVDRDNPKNIDLTLPGWGEWGGTGLQMSKRKKKKFIINAGPAIPRKDSLLGNVIISELKDESMRKHQVSKLPFPYANVQQFEQSVRAPVGNTWNPETTFKDLIKPKVITKLGSVIDPIDMAEGPELLRQVFLERGWIEFDEDDQEEHEWNLWWRTSRFRNCDYDQIYPWQRLNHYPKSTGITKKDCLARNLKRMKGVHGAGVYNFSPIAFNLPNDYTRFVAEYGKLKQQHSESKHILWICKPADLSRGRGIFLFRDISDLQYDCNAVVQQYISNPFLIGGYKFDIRVYVAVPSFHPLNIYIFEEGLVRFGTEKYDLNALHNVFAHLTNTSINKHSPGYALDKERVGPGCKWTITQLRQYFHQHNVNDSTLWTRIINIIILTLLVQAPQVPKCDNCFELYGFDILIDENLKPWLLEVNFSPALSFDCQADLLVKKPLLHDLMKLLNYNEKDLERGGDAFKKHHSRSRALDPYDRHSSMSHTSQRGGTLKKTTSFHKNISSLNKQQTAVQESAYFINEVPESKHEENMCFGLPLATPGDDGRPSSASSGISSVDSEKLEGTEEGGLMDRQRTMGMMSERSATACSRRLVSRDGRMKPEEYEEVNNNSVKGNIQNFMERSATMSSVVRRADYQQGSQSLTEKGSIKSSYTSDSGISSYSNSSHENSDLTTRPDCRRNSKLLPQRSQTNNLLCQQADQNQIAHRGDASPLFGHRNSTHNIKSLQPNETSNTLKKIAASGMTNSQQHYRSNGISSGAGNMKIRRNSMYQTRSAVRYPTPRSSRESTSSRYSNYQGNNNAVSGSRTQLYVSTSPVPRRLTRNAERQIAPPVRKSQNSRLALSSRHRVNSNGPKSKGPCSKVGDMFLVFPFSDVTLRTANSTLDPHVVIKETQRLLRESIHSVDKGSQGQKVGGHLPYGQPLDADRLWGPIKQLPEEAA
ncbi:uncharacterized protein LOC117328027 [Pecten maximus]|uniref:uncharacterized protein LOC117328027 n=1 Tax=Pecten maximus TaxID=6579 RepID=UPI0014590405|nr:uncharacterized protein LOC117328027 [Pecten maximus]